MTTSSDPAMDQQAMPPDAGGGPQFMPDDFEIPTEGAMARNPVSGTPSGMDETQVDEDEQAQYDEFTSMGLKIVHGLKAGGKNRGTSDVILDYFKADGVTVPKALGVATAEVCFTVHNFFKHNQTEISADVIFAAAQEILSEIYILARAAKVVPIDKLPPEGSPQEEQLLGKAMIYATEWFGNKLKETGQLPREEAAEHLNSEMKREAESGELDDWDPREGATADGLQFAMGKVREGIDRDPVAEMEAQGYPRMVDVKQQGA